MKERNKMYPVVKVTATKMRGKSRRIDMVYNGNDSKEDRIFLFREIILECEEQIKEIEKEETKNVDDE